MGIREGQDYCQLDMHKKALPKIYIWDLGGWYLEYVLLYSKSPRVSGLKIIIILFAHDSVVSDLVWR